MSNQIIIEDKSQNLTLNIEQPITQVIEVIEKGPKGDKGESGDSIFTPTENGFYQTTSSIQISDTLVVDKGITGSLEGTSSFSVSSSYASYAYTSSYTTAISGSTNYISKFIGNSTLGNSLIYDDGTNIGIGITNPTEKLEVDGYIKSKGIKIVDSLGPGFLTSEGLVDYTQYAVIVGGNLFKGDQVLQNSKLISNNYGTYSRFTLNRASNSITTPTIPSSGTRLGEINFGSYNGTTFANVSQIASFVDATSGVGDLPSKLVFYTTPDNSSTLTERMSINNLGRIRIGSTMNYSDALNIESGHIAFQNGFGIRSYNAAGSIYSILYTSNDKVIIKSLGDGVQIKNRANTESLINITDGGNVSLGVANPTEKLEVNGGVRALAFSTPDGTANQALTADGGVFDLSTISTAIEVTKTELDNLISSSQLVKGSLYKISGVNPDLYGGTTIFLTAIENNKLSIDGYGMFYNPKYDKSIDGFGIVKDYVFWKPVEEQTESGLYNIGDRVIWGGKHWNCISPTSIDTKYIINKFNLDTVYFEEIPFNETDYNVVYDEIKYDYEHDLIIERNEQNSNIVSFSYDSLTKLVYDGIGGDLVEYNSIKNFQWGNVFDYNLVKGIGSNEIKDSLNENINFSGIFQINLTFNNSYQYNLTFNNDSSQNNLTFNNSSQGNLTFNNSYQYNLTFINNSSQYKLTFNNSYQSNLTFNNSGQDDLNFNVSGQFNLTFTNSSQYTLTFTNSGQSNLTFNNSYQSNLTVTNNIYQRNLTIKNYNYDRANITLSQDEVGLTFDNTKQSIKLTGNQFFTGKTTNDFAQIGDIPQIGNIQGTANYIPKFTGNSILGNSLIYDNGNSVGIGLTSPQAKLDIKAQGALSTDIAFRVRNSTDTQNFLVVNGAGDVYNRGAKGVSSNTFFGENVGRNTTGNYNSAFGYNVLYLNTTGNYNSAFGTRALVSNTTGTYNSAFGNSALTSNTTGPYNNAFGNDALLSNTTGACNSAFGTQTLRFNTTGIYNNAFGYNALYSNTTGNYNSAFGYNVLYLNTTGNYNSAFGTQALVLNTTGNYNSALGYYALYLNTTGDNNTAFGTQALYSNTTGTSNSAFGVNAGRYTSSGSNNEISSNSIYLGYDTRPNANNETNQIVIGSTAIGNGSNSVTLGNDSITKTVLKGNVGIGTTSPSEKLEVSGSVKATGFKTPSGTANQALTADGGVFDLTTKADLVGGKVPKAQSQPSTMVMDSSTYVITFTDATGAIQTIDLPLESLFKDANYDETTKSLIVTLQDGTTRTIPLSDLVDLPEIVLATSNPAVTPTSGQKVYFNTSLGKVWFNVNGAWVFGGNLISDTEKTNLSTAYNHSQTTGNPHNTTKSDIGLGNVDNTSDLDKPISNATQLALNGKQNVLTNPVTGTGTTNYLSKFLSGGTIGNSLIYDDGISVGIGLTSSTSRLEINPLENQTALKISNYSVTGSNNQSALDISGTWNTSGTPTLIKSNVTDTASNTNSLLMDLQVGGVSRFRVLKNGDISIVTPGNDDGQRRLIGGRQTQQAFIQLFNASTGKMDFSSWNGAGFSFNGSISLSTGSIYLPNGQSLNGNNNSTYIPYEASTGNTIIRATSIDNFSAIRLQTGGSSADRMIINNMGATTFKSSFSPVSGTLIHNSLLVDTAINQTGGANGITRGLYINPTLTSAADWRAIETTNGRWVLTDIYSSGSGSLANPSLDINTTWNTSGTPTLIRANVTNTASNANSLLMDLQVGAVSVFRLQRNGILTFNGVGSALSIYGQQNGSPNAGTLAGFAFRSSLNNTTTGPDFEFLNGQANNTLTSGSGIVVRINRTFEPTSGTATYTSLQVNQTINQTGGANGATRGLYVNPTLTSAADWRSVEWSNNTGRGLYGIGTATNNIQGDIGLGLLTTPSAKLHVRGSGATSATTALRVENSTPTTLLTVQDSGQFTYNTPTMSLETTSSAYIINLNVSQSALVGAQVYGVNLTPTFFATTGSQTQTALRVNAVFTGSAAATSGSNIIADFGSTSAGSQLTVTDVTSGSIYMVNDVSGLPIIEATSDWTVNMYDFPNRVFRKTGSVLELGVQNNTGSAVNLFADTILNEGLGFTHRTTQASGSTVGAVTSSIWNINFSSVSSSVYVNATVTGFDTGSRDTITGDIKATIRYRAGVATIIGTNQTFINSDNAGVSFNIVAGGTSGSLQVYGSGSTTYQWGATVITQVI